MTEAAKQARRDYERQWRENNRDRVREYNRRYYAAHPEVMREAVKKWKKENPEKVREYNRKGGKKWRQKNAEHIREYNRAWRAAHRETIREYNNQYWENKARQAEGGTKYTDEKQTDGGSLTK